MNVYIADFCKGFFHDGQTMRPTAYDLFVMYGYVLSKMRMEQGRQHTTKGSVFPVIFRDRSRAVQRRGRKRN